ncbi:hypothetical protein F2Q70_00002069 [Brassica cretica]|uniref:Uncharacterized protein n=2 Tax=Brassica cretica TaxID=69181 RepID=A0A8S9ILK6_BRACR|nr:hypothetical protein F2Q68_00020112 [Brassica cretica]KAF2570232.1 hypothetical protein F2Q70_00002069 [Brassica cretica]KAF3560991.1 hypothetical protein DY000_02013468 [Brassica cretica]
MRDRIKNQNQSNVALPRNEFVEESHRPERVVAVERLIFDVRAIETPNTRQTPVGDPERCRDDDSSRLARAKRSPPRETPR